ncbi:type II toxin-antitoxin system VapC family toxin [bacterium]|nr:type II toxin-antitoxin system VapC family toxin [bacterium]
MILPDVNVLVYAFREDSPDHEKFRNWLQQCLDSSETLALTDFALSGFLRIVTHPKVFHPATPWERARHFVESLRQARMCIRVGPGDFHWDIFLGLCAHVNARGNTIPDAFLAAIAIERGCRLYSADHGFSRFPGLSWAHPLRP